MVQVMQNVPKLGRVQRRPTHNFSFRARPWQMTAFLLAPVLPGETLKNLFFQSRVVTDPIKGRLTGWWSEYYFFYVRLRDLTGAEDFEQMMLDPAKDMSAHKTPADVQSFHKGGINYRKMALDKIQEHYFRAPVETSLYLVDGIPVVSVDNQSVLDSAISISNFADESPDINVDANADSTITTREVENAMRMWEFAKANALTDMDFDDYLRTFGISVPKAQSDKPELLRLVREWQLPSNTINPANGTASTAVSWVIKDKISKDFFFREPGFVVGVYVPRPKVYMGKHDGSFTSLMDNALSWLPAMMWDDPMSSVRLFDRTTNSPITGQTENYYVDLRDLFIYGEQYTNHFADTAQAALPGPDMQKRYASKLDMQALFVDSAAAGTAQYVRQDGIVNLEILGSQRDSTPPLHRLSM